MVFISSLLQLKHSSYHISVGVMSEFRVVLQSFNILPYIVLAGACSRVLSQNSLSEVQVIFKCKDVDFTTERMKYKHERLMTITFFSPSIVFLFQFGTFVKF